MIVFGILAQGQAQTGALINNVLKDKHPPRCARCDLKQEGTRWGHGHPFLDSVLLLMHPGKGADVSSNAVPLRAQTEPEGNLPAYKMGWNTRP